MLGRSCTRATLALAASFALVPISAVRDAAAGTVVGANMGVSVLSAEGSSQTAIGIPHSGDIFFGGMRPGLRLGAIAADGKPEFFLDTGVSILAFEGDSYHSVVGTANYQHNFRPEVSTSPFITLGGGVGHVGFDGSNETVLVLGGGVGARHWLAHRHGATRLEIRYDHLSFTDSESDANVLSFKFGFDLMLSGQ